MFALYFEQQLGTFCGQHCINNALQLQGPRFSEIRLAKIGNELDEEERRVMAQSGENSPDYLAFLRNPSSNYDDNGLFSVQVIQKALKDHFGLTMSNFYDQPDEIIQTPASQTMFIIHLDNHWTPYRKFHGHWFDLNSLNQDPKPITDTALTELLDNFKKAGHMVYIVIGSYPECMADTWLTFEKLPEEPLEMGPNLSDVSGMLPDKIGILKSEVVRNQRETFLRGLEKKVEDSVTVSTLSTTNLSKERTNSEVVRHQRVKFLRDLEKKVEDSVTVSTTNLFKERTKSEVVRHREKFLRDSEKKVSKNLSVTVSTTNSSKESHK